MHRPVLGVTVAAMLSTLVFAQAPNLPLKFEVVSVKPNRDTKIPGMINSQPGGRFIVQNISLSSVIMAAYDLRRYQLVDVPAWVQRERFDIMALTGRDGFPSVVQLRPLIQALLADRFHLEVAREQRLLQTYALIRVRADALGPAMRPVNIDCTSPDRRDPALNKNPCGMRDLPGVLNGTAITSLILAFTLDAYIGTVVTDETGLGRQQFDVTLKWNPDGAAGAPDGVPIFTAVQEQLGLKLDPRRTSVDVVAIKQIERPTEN